MADKKIASVNIFEINAGKHILCGPPALWNLEAAADVTYEDNSVEIQYISTIDLGEVGWQVMTKSINALGENESAEPYIIARWEEDEDAFASPYEAAIRKLGSIFQEIAVL